MSIYTDLESSPLPYQAICSILANVDLTHPENPYALQPELQALLSTFSEADWHLFIRMAKAEGVAPLLFYASTRSAFEAPDEVNRELRMAYYESAAFNQMIIAELGQVVSRLDNASIPVIVLKGGALATTIYPDSALRPMNDLDLLVKPEDLERAKSIILSMGYYEPIPEMAKGFNQLAQYHFYFSHRDKSSLNLELHWNLLAGQHDTRAPSIEWFWENTQEISSITDENRNLQPYSTLSYTSHFLYLIGHCILQHGKFEARLIWFYDLLSIINNINIPLDWQNIYRYAEEYQWAPALYYAMQILASLFHCEIPGALADEFQRNPDIKNDKEIRIKWENSSAERSHALEQLVSTKGWKKFQLLFSYIFPDEAYMRWRYHYHPRWKVIYFYPYRWWDILVKGVKTIMHTDL